MNRAPVYVGGVFDLFHPGHVNLLLRANILGDVTVALNTDEFTERYKGRRPVMSLEERRSVVAACKYVERVIVNHGDEDSTKAILAVRPTYIVHGDDWVGAGLRDQMGLTDEFLAANEISLVYFPYTGGVSTGQIVDRCRELACA